MSNRVLVTGASGFLGRHTLQQLVHKGFEVYGVCFSNETLISQPYGVKWYKINLLESATVDTLIDSVNPDYLLHLAWDIRGEYRSSPANIDWLNSSLYLAYKFARTGKRAVFVGTCLEYDLNHIYRGEFNPDTLYGVCKHSLYEILKHSNLGNLSWAWARPFYIYGPYESPSRLIPSMINSALYYSPPMVLKHNGEQSIDYMYIDDVADALVTILLSSVESDVNICTGEFHSIRHLAEKIESLADSQPDRIKLGTEQAVPPMIYGSNENLKSLGWSQKVSLDRGLMRTIEWWRRVNSPKAETPPPVIEPEIVEEEPKKKRTKKDGSA